MIGPQRRSGCPAPRSMRGLWPGSLILFLCVTLFLVFIGQRIANRVEISKQGATVLMPLVPIGRDDLARGELIFLIYDAPEIIAQVRGGGWPDQGTIKVTLDQLTMSPIRRACMKAAGWRRLKSFSTTASAQPDWGAGLRTVGGLYSATTSS